MRRPYLFILGIALGLASCSRSPDPKSVISDVSNFYKQKNTVQVEGVVTNTVTVGSNTLHEGKSQRKVTLKRPNLMAVQTKEAGTWVSDGETMAITFPAPLNLHKTQKAPSNFDGLKAMNALGGPAALFPLQLMVEDPAASMMSDVTSATYVGREQLEGKAVHRLKFTQETMDWEIWVAAEGDPLVLQVAMNIDPLAKLDEAYRSEGDDMESKMVERFKNWKFDFQPAANTFAIVEPPNATAKPPANVRLYLGGEPADSPPAKIDNNPGANTSDQPLHVISAFYGVNQSWFDVTERVRSMVGKSPTWSRTVDNRDWGDPAPGYEIGNTLIVHYESRGVTRLAREYQGKVIQLVPPGPETRKSKPAASMNDPDRIAVLTAVYGVNQSWFDVTDKLINRIGDASNFSVVVHDRDWGDPAPEYEKGNTLIVRYQLGGRTKLAACYVGKKLTIR